MSTTGGSRDTENGTPMQAKAQHRGSLAAPVPLLFAPVASQKPGAETHHSAFHHIQLRSSPLALGN